MEENVVDSLQIKKSDQLTVDEWKNDLNETSNNDNKVQNVVEQLNDTSINDTSINDNTLIGNANSEKQGSSCNLVDSENVQNWINTNESNNHNDNKNNSEDRKGRGSYNKLNNSHSRGRGRGRGINKRFNNETESENNGYNQSTNNTLGSRGRGRGHHRGRGGKFNEKSLDGWYGNNEDGSKRKENKLAGPKAEYIPPDIENEESPIGIEAGLNFDKYKTIEVKVNGTNPPKCMTSFQTSNLCDVLLENLSSCNFSIPTPIQNYAIPIVMAGRDLMASAQTGSGKTAAYVLPILHNLLIQKTPLIFDDNHCEPHVVIMAPTRELVVQICECVWKFSKRTHIKNGLLYGGTSIEHQKLKLLQGGVHILTTTPGRLNDFVEKGIVTFSSVKFFVLDEADRMLDMGFKPNIEHVLNHPTMTLKEIRQTLMFSATFASEIQHMATSYLKPDYLFVSVGEIGGACKDVVQTVIEVPKFQKKATLLNILKDMINCQGTIVFVEKKRYADYIAAYLSELDFPTTSIHGDREQPERERALSDFKTNKMKILVATAVAARGLDINGVNNVINVDLPKTIEEYVHRIGRTGRLGNIGKAISFFDPESDNSLASELIRILKQAEQEVPTWLSDVAKHIHVTPAIDDFSDIRTNIEVSSERVEIEEEEEW